jgi:hypothetical protein
MLVTRSRHRTMAGLSAPLVVLIGCLMVAGPLLGADASVCRGTTAKGRLEHGCRLRRAGPNFSVTTSTSMWTSLFPANRSEIALPTS